MSRSSYSPLGIPIAGFLFEQKIWQLLLGYEMWPVQSLGFAVHISFLCNVFSLSVQGGQQLLKAVFWRYFACNPTQDGV